MRHRHRGVLAVLSIVALVIAVSLIGWRGWAMILPDPGEADAPALLRWLVLKELADEPRQRQVVVVDRLILELDQGIASTADASSLSEQHRRRLQRNLRLLKRVWFETRVDRFERLPASGQWDFVQTQVATVLLWADLSSSGVALAPATEESDAASASHRHAATIGFFSELEIWIAEADPQRAESMRRAVQAGLTCWLATRDLAAEPLATRSEIAGRIVAQLESGLQLNQVADEMDVARQATLKANGLLLMEAWLLDEAAQYANLPAEERTAYVDSRLDQVEKWGLIDFLNTGNQPSAPEGPPSGMVALMTQVNIWIARAEPHRQPELRALVGHLQQRILWRSFQNLLN